MSLKLIPPSPNWYCSKIIDSNSSGILVFGTRHDVYIFGCIGYPPVFKSVFTGHKEKLTALTLCEHEDYASFCCSASEEGIVKLWNTNDCAINSEHSIHAVTIVADTRFLVLLFIFQFQNGQACRELLSINLN